MDEDLIPTRQSLLSRLKDWEDWNSWQEFFHTYWRLIYKTARGAGLNPNEAEEVVQDTLITVSKSIRGFKYDSQKGSFKSWLRTTTIWRIRDHVRARHRQQTVAAAVSAESPGPGRTAGEETIGSNWDSDWEENLADAALERVKRRVDPKHFQMFDLATVKQWPTEKIAKTFQVSGGYVYLIKHRIRNQLRAEMKKLKADASRPAP